MKKSIAMPLMIVVALSSLFFVNGCSTVPKVAESAIQHNFRIENSVGMGIVQIFELKNQTAIQFRNVSQQRPKIYNEFNEEMTFSIIGETVIVSRLMSNFRIVTSTGIATVTRNGNAPNDFSKPTAQNQVAVTTSNLASDSVSPEALRVQLENMRREIEMLKKFIADNSPKTPVVKLAPIPEIIQVDNRAVKITEKPIETYRFGFENNSSKLNIDSVTASKLIERARTAVQIRVIGYTDTTIPNKPSEDLAKGRALAVKTLLMNNGIDGKLITVSHIASGGFIADNTTKVGKDSNRRVEIMIAFG